MSCIKKEQDICSICLCVLFNSDNLITSCKHTFHKKCINRWIIQNNNCPLCRTFSPIPKKQIYTDFLVSSIILMPDIVIDVIEHFFNIIGIKDFDEFHFINQLIISNICVFTSGNVIEKQEARSNILIKISTRTREILIRRILN